MSSLLEKNVRYLDEQYRIGDALISDKAFNQLERSLLRTDPQLDYFDQRSNLFLPLIGEGNYKEFLANLLVNTRLSIQPKIAGCAIAIKYINGKFNKAITRKGFDVSSKIKKIKNVPSSIPVQRDLQVRGELYSPNETPYFSKKLKGLNPGGLFTPLELDLSDLKNIVEVQSKIFNNFENLDLLILSLIHI